MFQSHRKPSLQRLGLSLSLPILVLAGCSNPTTAPELGAPTNAGAGKAHALSVGPTLSATATATSGSFTADRAVDGNTDTEWQSGYVTNPALTVDMGVAMSLTAVGIKVNPTAGSYTIQASNDGSTWTSVLSNQTNSTWNVETKKLTTSARYLRFTFANSGKNVMVFEIQPQGTPVASPTPAPSASATPAPSASASTAPATGTPSITASNTNGSYVASRAIDGDASTEWQSGAVSNPTLTYDLGATEAIASLNIKTNPGFGTYAIDASADGSTWISALTNQSNTTWGMETKALKTTARYLRFKFANSGKNVMVFEAQPQGTVVAPSPAPSASATPAPVASATPTPAPSPSATPTPAPVSSPAPSGAFHTYFGNQSVPKLNNAYTTGYSLISDLGMTTIREGWNWKNIETGNNQYVSWMSMYDGKMAGLAQLGLKTQVMICDTPTWASTNGTQYGVPTGLNLPIFADGTDVYKPGVQVNPNNYYARYIFNLATRYKGEIKYWQVWNEPDFPSGDLGAGTVGSNGNTRYWDGSVQDYVRLLKVTNAIAKGIDPSAKITLGGLGYENYLAAIIDNGGAPYFDVVDFHAYGTDKTSSNGVLNSAWGFLGRYNAMKGVLQSKGVTGKTFSCSETGFTANTPSEQASYVAKVFAAGLAQGDVEAVQWAVFTNPGYNNIGIIDSATLTQKTQGYPAYKFATSELTGATPQGAVSGTGVQGYKFTRADGKPLYVVWSTATSASVTLPVGSGQVLDKFGNAKTASFSGGQLTLSLNADPLYVVGN